MAKRSERGQAQPTLVEAALTELDRFDDEERHLQGRLRELDATREEREAKLRKDAKDLAQQACGGLEDPPQTLVEVVEAEEDALATLAGEEKEIRAELEGLKPKRVSAIRSSLSEAWRLYVEAKKSELEQIPGTVEVVQRAVEPYQSARKACEEASERYRRLISAARSVAGASSLRLEDGMRSKLQEPTEPGPGVRTSYRARRDWQLVNMLAATLAGPEFDPERSAELEEVAPW